MPTAFLRSKSRTGCAHLWRGAGARGGPLDAWRTVNGSTLRGDPPWPVLTVDDTRAALHLLASKWT
jgi:hypothetical protein